MAVNLAKEIDADLVMASDPDADRVGIACKDDKGEWVLINGNQTCMMYLYYIPDTVQNNWVRLKVASSA